MSWRCIAWARKQLVGSASAKAVLICLAHHADEKGYCWPSQETISAETEISVDSVQRAFKRHLEGKFVRRIKRKSTDGRRISYASELMLDRTPADHKSASCGAAPCGIAEAGNRAANALPAKPQIDPSPDGNVRPKSLEEQIQESSNRTLRNTPGGVRLLKWLGKAQFDAWFAKVLLIGERDQYLILQADTKFIAD